MYFEFRLVFIVRHVFFVISFLPHCRALRQPITSVEFKFVARQVVSSVVIREAKLKFVADGRLVCATCCLSLQHGILLRVGHKSGNTRRVFQLAMQQFCETS